MNIFSFLIKPKPPQHAKAAPVKDEPELRLKREWGWDVLDHQAWLAQSPACLTLLDWLEQGWRYIHFLGPEGYRNEVARMLSRVSNADLAAIGFDMPSPDAVYGYRGCAAGMVYCQHSQDATHVSVHWSCDHTPHDELWIDGQLVQPPAGQDHGPSEDWGRWVANRYYTAHIPGPDDHPQQGLDFSNFGRIRGLLIYDAETRHLSTHQPSAIEQWTDPYLVCDDQHQLLIYPNEEADTPDRRITASC